MGGQSYLALRREWRSQLWNSRLAQLDEGIDGNDLCTVKGAIVMLGMVGIPQIDDVNHDAMRTAVDDDGGKFQDISSTGIEWLNPDPHVMPRSQGCAYVGATNIISNAPRTTPLISDMLFMLGCAIHQVRRDLPESGSERIQVGNRPVPADGFPLLGQAGVSPVLAPIQALTCEEVIDTSVTHMLATGYAYAWSIPIEWPYIMGEYLRQRYSEFADEPDPQFTPPPEPLAGSRLCPDLIKSLRDYYSANRAGE
ncbi:hypothetical protein [Streptomyces prasinus]|uniref:Uncharacterized protein n=1 Tax=Streptomyces prasinus TaxID=67345 RepID=A0ABX6ASJ4_9ACTN|nr:hypothetical protein [Streptomyces prasinus]QEV04993.1 hypothetical protein CP972_04220 [Streptomyces prasinus]